MLGVLCRFDALRLCVNVNRPLIPCHLCHWHISRGMNDSNTKDASLVLLNNCSDGTFFCVILL